MNWDKKEEFIQRMLNQNLISASKKKYPSLDYITDLVKYGADIECYYDYRGTPLNRAVRNKRLETAELLLELGAKVNRKCNGEVPLNLACSNKCIKMVTLLLKHGANPYLKDGNNETAFDVAKKQKSKTIINLLNQNK